MGPMLQHVQQETSGMGNAEIQLRMVLAGVNQRRQLWLQNASRGTHLESSGWGLETESLTYYTPLHLQFVARKHAY